MIKVLEIASAFASGGVENILFNYFSDKESFSNFNIDFLSHQEDGLVHDKLIKKGYRVFYVVPKKKNIFMYLIELNRIIKKGHYDIIHIHQNQMSFFPALIACFHSVKIRIAHSHFAYIERSCVKRFSDSIYSKLTRLFCTHYWACGKDAGEWLFSDTEPDVFYMKNAIDFSKFIRTQEIAQKIKNELSIKDVKTIICQIARFDIQKNHKYTIELLSTLRQYTNDFVCIFLGDGSLFEDIKEYAKQMKLMDNIRFLGNVNNVYDYLSCVDISILPSLWEGLPVTCIETQLMGIKTLISDKVTDEVCITSFCKRLSLVDMNLWITEIMAFHNEKKKNYEECAELLRKEGYDLDLARRTVVDKYCDYYTKIN